MRNCTAVALVFWNTVTDCFTGKHKGTRKLIEMFLYMPNLTSVTAGTSDCSTRPESHNNIGCTANKSVPLLQQRCTTKIGTVG